MRQMLLQAQGQRESQTARSGTWQEAKKTRRSGKRQKTREGRRVFARSIVLLFGA